LQIFKKKILKPLLVLLAFEVKPVYMSKLVQLHAHSTEMNPVHSAVLNTSDHIQKLFCVLTWGKLSLSSGIDIVPPSASFQVESTEFVMSSRIRDVSFIKNLYNTTIMFAGL
jgi:hypothetical protein